MQNLNFVIFLCPVAFLSQLLTCRFLLLSPSRQVTEMNPLERNPLLRTPWHPSITHPPQNQTVCLQLFKKNLPCLPLVVLGLVAPWESGSAQSRGSSPWALGQPRVQWNLMCLS